MATQTQTRGVLVGERVADLDTPALVLDLDLFERNVERIVRHCRERGVGWRPQSKGMRVQAVWRPDEELRETADNVHHWAPTGEPDVEIASYELVGAPGPPAQDGDDA